MTKLISLHSQFRIVSTELQTGIPPTSSPSCSRTLAFLAPQVHLQQGRVGTAYIQRLKGLAYLRRETSKNRYYRNFSAQEISNKLNICLLEQIITK